jgi:hypothetical protein
MTLIYMTSLKSIGDVEVIHNIAEAASTIIAVCFSLRRKTVELHRTQ